MKLRDNCGLTGLGFALTLTASILVVVATIVTLIVTLSRHFGRQACRTYAVQTNRETKFVIYATLGSGDCLTRTRDGRWIPTANLREFGR